MTTPREAALAGLDRARANREAIAREYLKPTGQRDYERIADLRTAIRADLLEAQVQALLANSTTVALVVDNSHDAAQAVRLLERSEALTPHEAEGRTF